MTKEPSPDDTDRLLAKLTPAEIRCLELVAKGLTSKAIGRETKLSPNTVDVYIKSATKKLHVRKRSIAAQMLVGAAIRETPILVYENPSIPADADFVNKGTSTGHGDGPGDLNQREPRPSESPASESGSAWSEPYNPITKFFGGDNRLSISQRLIRIVGLSIGAAIAMGILINALAYFSRMLSSPL